MKYSGKYMEDVRSLNFLFKRKIKRLKFSQEDIDEYMILMEFLGRDLPYNQFEIETEYKKYFFIRFCKTNKYYDRIPLSLIISFINMKEDLN